MTIRKVEAARAVWGLTLLIAPRLMLEQVHRVDADRRAIVVTRILGARQLSQAALSGVRPSPEVLAMGVWVDAAHSVTAAGLAVADRTRARAALADAVVAGIWAILGGRDLGCGSVPPRAHDRRRDLLARVVLRVVPGGRPLLDRVAGARGRIPGESDRFRSPHQVRSPRSARAAEISDR